MNQHDIEHAVAHQIEQDIASMRELRQTVDDCNEFTRKCNAACLAVIAVATPILLVAFALGG